ncbi:MAG: hypothetical protein HN726_03805 [Candidatus Magasanikbacteria bacterium]|jgi:hypothetical protein|nr:hypothetical protein [Candidatus Magasanikbacteria bacterium]MBT4221004.1 hypothetical protein [Candidatus Magasanikbacteria bacterium]MBT4350522.1 hypothetical protein [Candidatus Magasanikbacteria bacterium]MBT4541925.1 hypothetical protein [Candidatus Magasanikbacteria bacterium]MBT6253056.1 hypothetical protein [Candidatus Magasanikbacteria bacterium]
MFSFFSYRYSLFIFFISLFGLLFFGFVGTSFAEDPDHTIRDTSYAVRYVDQSALDPVTIHAGETKTINFRFKNVGSSTLVASGARYISAHTIQPRYHASLWKGANWVDQTETASITSNVLPGGIATLPLSIHVPVDTISGDYTEEFYLAAQSYSWVKGGYFYIKIRVVPAVVEEIIPETPIESEKEDIVSSLRVKKFIVSRKEVTAKGGELVKVVVAYKNIGETAWDNFSLVANRPVSVASSDVKDLSFADESWKSHTVVFSHTDNVEMDGVLRKTITFRVPEHKGNYVLSFQPQVDEELIVGASAEVQIHVTENAKLYTPILFSNTSDIIIDQPRLSEEARVRVGIYHKDTTLEFVANDDEYRISNETKIFGVLPKGEKASITFSNGTYTLTIQDDVYKTSRYFRFVPINNPHSISSFTTLSRPLRNQPRNYNTYRGAIEFRQGENDGKMYIVNDVLMEDYLSGIAETSDFAPIEYIKSLLTAARTYAYLSKDKYPFFDVLGSTHDQLYLGYESEKIRPHVVEASKATRGYIVTYDDNPAITPYHGNTDGMTKNARDVWGWRHTPWLVPVEATYDRRDGKRLFGHGIGMSQRDAAIRADEGGASWTDLLTYYYTGVEVERFYF